MLMLAGLGWAWLGATWVGYPLWLALSPRRPLGRGGPLPRRIVILCVVRDEARVARRLDELEQLEREGLEVSVLLVDDGSEDAVVAPGRDMPVEVVRLPKVGKAQAIVAGLERVQDADAVVFCDARQRIPSRALKALLEPFADPAVGAVSGEVVKPARTLAGLYWRYETWVRRLESRTGSVVGATGPWHALRREALPDRPEAWVEGLLLDDVWLPMQAVMRGFRAVVAEGAAVEDVEHSVGVERTKKTRTLTGNLQLLGRWPALWSKANPARGRYAWHKLARLGTPIAVGAIVGAAWVGAVVPGPLQGFWCGCAVVGGVALGVALVTPRGREAVGLATAMVESWVRYVRRDFRW